MCLPAHPVLCKLVLDKSQPVNMVLDTQEETKVAYDDDPDLADRILAAFIAMLFAAPIGWGVNALVSFVAETSAAVFWLVIVAFAVFAFFYPRKSRDLLTQVWHGIIRWMRDLRLWW